MNEVLQFLAQHGPLVLFLAAFVEQAGIPLPASPWMLAAGALIGQGKVHALSAIGAAASGSMLADLLWFFLGRRYGNRILKLLCRVSLEPDSCVRRAQNVYSRFKLRGMIVAKFIPGLSTLTPPLAGSSGVGLSRFVFYDALSCCLYVGCFIAIGLVFSHQLEQILDALAGFGRGALALVIGLLVVYIGYKYYARRRFLKELRMARITVDELRQKLEAGEPLVILDLRSQDELDQDPSIIRGALRMRADELQTRHQDIPRDREIILYCSCPDEESSARTALLLHRKGILRVRPLLGGFDAWRDRKYPLDTHVVKVTDFLSLS